MPSRIIPTAVGGTDPITLLTPGPAGTSPAVKRALSRGDWNHREPEFAALLGRIRAELVRLLGVAETHEAIMVTGSGTAAAELAVISSVRPGRSLLALCNGVYGHRLAAIAAVHGIPVHKVEAEWTTPIEPATVRAALVAHPDVDAVTCVQHETSTGLVNPVDAIGAAVKEAGALFVLDAISATAAEEVGHAASSADLICGTANKGLHSVPGISYVLVDDAAVRRIREVPRRSVYLDAGGNLDAQRRGEVLFTPAVQICFALEVALRELAESGGVAVRTAEYRARAASVRTGLANLGLHPIVAEVDRANSVSMFPLPAGMTYPQLHDAVKDAGFIIYAGQGHLTNGHFRVATMGELSIVALARFVATMESVVVNR